MGEAQEQPEPWIPKPPTDSTFADRLRLVRWHMGGISQREAAERCGVKRATWSSWEMNPERSPRNVNEIARRIHDAFGVDLYWLAFGPDSPNVHVPVGQGSLLLPDGSEAFDFARSAPGLVGVAS